MINKSCSFTVTPRVAAKSSLFPLLKIRRDGFVKSLCRTILDMPEFTGLRNRLEGSGGVTMVCGVPPTFRAILAAAIRRETGRFTAVLCPTDAVATAIAGDISFFSGLECAVLPSREPVFYPVEGISRPFEQQRLAVFHQILQGQAGFLIGTPESIMLRTIPPALLKESIITLTLDADYAMEELIDKLVTMGYRRAEQVEGAGQFARRGGILDVFPVQMSQPVRMEFFGDTLDAMGVFNPISQRRTDNLRRVEILPAGEVVPAMAPGGLAELAQKVHGLAKGRKAHLPPRFLETIAADVAALESNTSLTAADRYLPLIYPEFASALDYLPEDTVFILDDGARVQEGVRRLERSWLEEQKRLLETGLLAGKMTEIYLSSEELYRALSTRNTILTEHLATQNSEMRLKEIVSLLVKQLPAYGGSVDPLMADANSYASAGFGVIIVAKSSGRLRRLADRLEEEKLYPILDYSGTGLPTPGKVMLTVGDVSGGIEMPGLRLVLLPETEAERKIVRPKTKGERVKGARQKLKSFTDLKEGDLVVHDTHGIGRFGGIVRIQSDGVERDFIKIAYAGSDVLYIPASQLDVISKYLGASEESSVRLSKLGGADWARVTSRAKSAAKDMAKKLIELYARRQRLPGHAFSKDDSWQREFEENFEYEETEDQIQASEEIKRDMEKPVPMDRLLCGDVGFGKTEVAFRAVMKCITDGKQAAILVPTTVLARQHYMNALRRFRGYPVEIAMLSRFTAPKEAEKILRRLKSGSIDLVIGTHKLLGQNVAFSDLGLLVIDEEQRFGVAHKERLKAISQNCDVLTLSATPIPRTLNMALAGIRDMSTLEESPRDRHPVATYVLEYDPLVISDAIAKELGRGGQVYYLHNRVDTIEKAEARVAKLAPGARILIGHGRMDQEELGEVMSQMADGQADILVCTTIIESGIDIPNANTLIIEHADRLGLAQLHQLRGRVGRSSRRAYAYLTVPAGRVLTEVSQKRLAAIRDFAEFGAGFKIAMRDLEIRGAGNLLGQEQSGHMLSVGYDMYLRLLEEAVLEEQGQTPQKKLECVVELKVSANIPATYVSSNVERMDLYRKISAIETDEDYSDVLDELCDRYGDPPEEVEALLRIALLRARAGQQGIIEITDKSGSLCFYMPQPDLQKISAVSTVPEFRGKLLFNAGEKPYLALRLKFNQDVLALAEALVSALEKTQN
jgi:transcription-repair coupling factor (superfamily II helicase)